MSDNISNLIVKIMNASKAGKESVVFTHSKLVAAVIDALVKSGFVESVSKKGKKSKIIEIKLAYKDDASVINGVKRVSKFSKRVYKDLKHLRSVRNGFGALMLSTTKGIMTDREARKLKVGGEALFEIW